MADIKVNQDSLKPSRQWVRHKVKDGTNTYRILPPFGEKANGYPYRKWSLIWGLKDPTQGRMRPFSSSLTTEKKCPAVEFVDALTLLAKEKISLLEQQGKSKEVIKTINKDLNELISDLRPKTLFLYNAVDQAGIVGILEVKTTANKKLKKLMMNYINDYGQDPTSLQSEETDSGVWFNFMRTGLGFDTEYDVAKKQTQKKINGEIVYVDDRSPLPENVVQNYDDLAYDVHSLYEQKTYDELKTILLANMKDIGERCPEALVVAEKIGLFSGATVQQTPAAASAVTPTKKVALNLGAEDDVKLAKTTPTVDTTTGVNAAGGEDILAIAKGLLDD